MLDKAEINDRLLYNEKNIMTSTFQRSITLKVQSGFHQKSLHYIEFPNINM